MSRHATDAEIRHAHRELARLLHPDHLANVPLKSADRALAGVRIREVNEAWRILGSAPSRANYDATLAPEEPHWDPPWESNPPRRFTTHPRQPTYKPAAHRVAGQRPATRENPSRPFHWAPVVIWLVTMLTAIVLLIVLLANRSSSSEKPIPQPSARTCVQIESGPRTVVVPCTEPNVGSVVSSASTPAGCPAGTTARRLDPGDVDLSCLQPTTGP